MTRELSHDEAFVALDALALDALDAAERGAVLAHVARCSICRAELDGLQAASAQIAFAVASGEDRAARERTRSRLMARAAAGTSADGSIAPPAAVRAESTHPSRSPSLPVMLPQGAAGAGRSGVPTDQLDRVRVFNMLAWRRAEWVALAASVLMVVSVGMLARVLKDRSNVQEALKAQVAARQSAITAGDSLRLAVASRDSLIAGLIGRDVAVMSLTSTGVKPPFARMFWDRAHNTWTLVAHDMPPLKPGRTYQLWLVTPSAKISAGTFDPRNGDAVVRATYALPASGLKALAVTEEPTGGAPQPTGALVIAVSAQ